MFQDIGVSKDLNEQFRRHLSETLSNEPLDIDFQIQVSGVEKKLALREIKLYFISIAFDSLEIIFIYIYIQVLSSGSWPFQQSCVFSLPTELERCVHRFTAFYGGQHSGRKLNWLYHMSKGELVTNCFRNRYIPSLIKR